MGSADPLADEDLQLSLWLCYELHYRGLAGVTDELEWDPELLRFRQQLEAVFERALRRQVRTSSGLSAEAVPPAVLDAVTRDDGPPLSKYLQKKAGREQFAEFVQHRSIYHLKEADPHSWGLPRLTGAAKAALVEIQTDEYGGGQAARMHSTLFRDTMRGFGLELDYGAYLDDVPACTLAVSNLMSMFGLHRRWRGALAGHLAAFEMTSSLPNARYAQGVRRLGLDDRTAHFYDEHVEADAVHEQIALYDLCGSLAAAEPQLADDIVFGAQCALFVDNCFAEHVLACWLAGRKSLR